MKLTAVIEDWDVDILQAFTRLCGWARAHARSGDASMIGG
jgi:uncharacterized protein DUF2252